MVASRFVALAEKNFDITGCDEKTLDITDQASVKNFFDKNTFDAIINFAAFTNVDKAEEQKGDEGGLVWKLNVDGPKFLLEVAQNRNIFLVHISTDFVFPGNSEYPGPYSEDAVLPDEPKGIGWYGWTKNRAEKVVFESRARYSIIRYGYPFRADDYPLKKDWARNLLELYDENKLYPLFTDQIQNILLIDDLVNPLNMILDQELEGVFHIASCDTTTPFNAGKYLLEKYSGHSVKIEEGSMKKFLESQGRTPRPILGGLKVNNTEQKLGLEFRTWKEMIDEFISKLNP